MKHLMRAIAFTGIALLAGCASFPQNQLAQANLPKPAQTTSKPSAYAHIQFFRGEPTAANAPELGANVPGVGPVIAAVQTAIEDSGLFSKVSFDASSSTNSDLQLNVRIYNHGNIGLAAISGFLTGFTFGVIPGGATDHYTMNMNVYDKGNRLLTSTSNEDSITTYMGLIFIPLMGNTPKEAVTETLTNQVRDSLVRAYKTGKLSVASPVATAAPTATARGL